jgi:hypothetical protein
MGSLDQVRLGVVRGCGRESDAQFSAYLFQQATCELTSVVARYALRWALAAEHLSFQYFYH